MKAAKFFAGATLLLLTACSPKVTTHITKAYPGVIPADSVHVIELGETIPNTAQMIGRVFVADRRTSTKCEYDQVLRLAKEATGKNGGNGLAITEHLEPSRWRSPCHQISGLMLRLSDMEVDTLKVNSLQDMVDLEHLEARKRKEGRRAPANTFEGSIGYGWITSSIYDADGYSMGSKSGLEWKFSYEYTWSNNWGVGLQYSGFRTSFPGGNMTLSYIAPEWVARYRWNKLILKAGLGIGAFLYHEPFYNSAGVGAHVTVGLEYMLTNHWGVGVSLNTVNGTLPDRGDVILNDNERTGVSRINVLGGLRYYF